MKQTHSQTLTFIFTYTHTLSLSHVCYISDEEFIDLEKKFEENELNSAVYLISMAMQISNFAVNYKVCTLHCTQTSVIT